MLRHHIMGDEQDNFRTNAEEKNLFTIHSSAFNLKNTTITTVLNLTCRIKSRVLTPCFQHPQRYAAFLFPPHRARQLCTYAAYEHRDTVWNPRCRGQRFKNTQWICRVQLKCDGTRWRTRGEVNGKLANGVDSQYASHYLGTWCIQHYYRWCAHLGCQ